MLPGCTFGNLATASGIFLHLVAADKVINQVSQVHVHMLGNVDSHGYECPAYGWLSVQILQP